MKNDKNDVKQGIDVGKTIIQIVITIATIELCIMAFMANYLHNIPATVETALDALLLALLSAPFIYFWIIKPYIISRDQAETQLSHMAHHDYLTQLPNRRFLSTFLKKCLSTCKRYDMHGSILLIDLNGFKEINDTYGHDAGDEVLKTTAQRLSSVVRTEDIVSRMGGDEFVVAIGPLPITEEQILTNAKATAKKLQTALKTPIEFNEKKLQISASIGIRTFGANDLEADIILKDADNAMYHAKHQQPANDTYICFDDLNERII